MKTVRGRIINSLTVSVFYSIFGIAWVFLTNNLFINYYTENIGILKHAELIAEALFVICSAVLVFALIYFFNKRYDLSLKKHYSAQQFDHNNLKALINNTSDLMWSVDKDFKLITSNKAFDDQVLKRSGQVIKQGNSTLEAAFGEKQLNDFIGYYQRAFSGESFTIVRFTEVPENSWAEISFYPIRHEGLVIGTACFSKNITERKLAEQEITQKNNALRDLSNHLQNIREEERAHISREIHDELGQQLTALKMDIGWVIHKQVNPTEQMQTKLEKMLRFNEGLIATVRKISSDLRPAIIDDLGLIPALEWLCSDFTLKNKIPCRFTSDIAERKFDSNFSITAYRILQESLTNISRHANASAVSVSVAENGDCLELVIDDNGKGVQNEKKPNVKTLGILGMKERASLLGGELTIKGIENSGTIVKLKLPLEHEYINC